MPLLRVAELPQDPVLLLVRRCDEAVLRRTHAQEHTLAPPPLHEAGRNDAFEVVLEVALAALVVRPLQDGQLAGREACALVGHDLRACRGDQVPRQGKRVFRRRSAAGAGGRLLPLPRCVQGAAPSPPDGLEKRRVLAADDAERGGQHGQRHEVGALAVVLLALAAVAVAAALRVVQVVQALLATLSCDACREQDVEVQRVQRLCRRHHAVRKPAVLALTVGGQHVVVHQEAPQRLDGAGEGGVEVRRLVLPAALQRRVVQDLRRLRRRRAARERCGDRPLVDGPRQVPYHGAERVQHPLEVHTVHAEEGRPRQRPKQRLAAPLVRLAHLRERLVQLLRQPAEVPLQRLRQRRRRSAGAASRLPQLSHLRLRLAAREQQPQHAGVHLVEPGQARRLVLLARHRRAGAPRQHARAGLAHAGEHFLRPHLSDPCLRQRLQKREQRRRAGLEREVHSQRPVGASALLAAARAADEAEAEQHVGALPVVRAEVQRRHEGRLQAARHLRPPRAAFLPAVPAHLRLPLHPLDDAVQRLHRGGPVGAARQHRRQGRVRRGGCARGGGRSQHGVGVGNCVVRVLQGAARNVCGVHLLRLRERRSRVEAARRRPRVHAEQLLGGQGEGGQRPRACLLLVQRVEVCEEHLRSPRVRHAQRDGEGVVGRHGWAALCADLVHLAHLARGAAAGQHGGRAVLIHTVGTLPHLCRLLEPVASAAGVHPKQLPGAYSVAHLFFVLA
eukprot:Rhum_TRINITY_DN14144_c16_g1::Rhum_TRINITY_DN14144_c16_g1_i1::g.70824::m.70824